MVDYSIATQVRPFQMPNVGEMYGQIQNIQLNRMRMAEAQETAQERNALRGLLSSGVDLNTPEGIAQLRRAAPMLAPQFEQAAGQRAFQRAQIERIQSQNDREALQTAQTFLPQIRTPEQWAATRPALIARFPQYAHLFRPEYSPELIRELALGAESLRTQYFSRDDGVVAVQGGQGRVVPGTTPTPRPEFTTIDGVPVARTREGDTFRIRPVLQGDEPAPAPPAAPAQPAPPAGAAPRTPPSRSTDLPTLEGAIDRAEGTDRNPRSSARGRFQFLDETFAEEFRRAFPDAARGKTDEELQSFRGRLLQDGRRVEDVLGPAFIQRNAQTLQQAGFQPVGSNVYLAHHFGANGALRLLNADPSTPVERIFTERVLNANPFLRGLAAGQVMQWASNAVDYGPGEARRLLDASRAPAVEPGGTPAAAPPNAMAPAAAAPAPAPANAFVAPPAAAAPAAAAPAAAPSMFPRTPAEARARALALEEDKAAARETGQLRARTRDQAANDLTVMTEALSIIDSITAPRRDMPEGNSLLRTATGSFAGAYGRDLINRATGTESAANSAALALEAQQAALVSLLPRMRGDLNRAEFDSLMAQAGKIGDRTQTYESRLLALNTVRDRLSRIQQRLATQAGVELPPTPAPATPPPAAGARGAADGGSPRLRPDGRTARITGQQGSASTTAAPGAEAPPVPPGVEATPEEWSLLWSVMPERERALWRRN